ncbi:MAG: 4-alpha-glucanotransferase [Chloroflexota bacterium]
MADPRAAGLLLHPTSLPGRAGIGSIDASAYAFVDTLAAARMQLWQVLPLGPTGYGDSPYAGLSAFAGNPLLIGLDELVKNGLLTSTEIADSPSFPENRVDFGAVNPWKMRMLRTAFERVHSDSGAAANLAAFTADNADWLDDFALFAAIKDDHGGRPWNDWESELRQRDTAALDHARERLDTEIALQRWIQYTFFQQWNALKRYANAQEIRIVGDMPIFVAYDSADVWAHQNLFRLTRDGAPEVVAGVPPDYFSRTGQLWGNPHYRWDVMEGSGFAWWISRFRTLQTLVDIVRLDHFRGFAAAWEVPFGNPTAERGQWVEGPRQAFFDSVHAAVSGLQIIAEDLGVITPDVEELRDRYGYPGMQILQFAFSTDAHDPTLPHNFHANTVVYSGTHDNDTTIGWWTQISQEERQRARDYLGTQGLDIAWDLLRLAFASVARFALVPLQDVLRLGTSARMNEPGRPEGNWGWRFRDGDLNQAHIDGLRYLACTYGRCP